MTIPATSPDLQQQLADADRALCALHQLHEQALRHAADEAGVSMRRLQRTTDERLRFASQSLLRDLLAVADNLGRAVASPDAEGVKLVYDQMGQVLANHGVTLIPAAQGQALDLNLHEVVDVREGPAGTIVEVVALGFMLHDRVLRPARVAVGQR